MKCSVKNCNNNRNRSRKINFFNFPSDKVLLKQWKSFCYLKNDINVKSLKICMEHFKPEDFENSMQYRMGFTTKLYLKRGVVPTVRKLSSKEEERHKARAERVQKREHKKMIEILIKEHNAESSSHNDENKSTEYPVEANVLIGDQIESEKQLRTASEVRLGQQSDSEIEYLGREIECLRKENASLQHTTKVQLAEIKTLKRQKERDSEVYRKNLESLQTQLSKSKFQLNNLEEKLLLIFTKSQIEKIKSGNKCNIWCEKDIIQAIALYTESLKVYKLMHRMRFPLPEIRTLQAWRQKAYSSAGPIK